MVKTVKDLIELARKTPGDITYSSGGVGSPQHLATEMFQAYAGVKLLHVPYKGASQAALAVAAGEVQLMSMALSLAQPFLGDARVRLIGYCGMERHSQFPDIPTLDEQGVANYDYSSWISLFAHKDVPADVVALLRKEAQAVVNDKALQEKLTKSGLDPWARSPEQLTKIVQDDYAIPQEAPIEKILHHHIQANRIGNHHYRILSGTGRSIRRQSMGPNPRDPTAKNPAPPG